MWSVSDSETTNVGILSSNNVTSATSVVHLFVYRVECHHVQMALFVFAAAPEWAETINNTQIDIGSEHTMRCVASGKPFPFIRWYKDGYMVKSHVFCYLP